MEKKDLLKNPIRHMDLHSVSNIDQLLRGFETTSNQSRNLAKVRIVLDNMAKDETTAIFLGIAGVIVPGDMRRIHLDHYRRSEMGVV